MLHIRAHLLHMFPDEKLYDEFLAASFRSLIAIQLPHTNMLLMKMATSMRVFVQNELVKMNRPLEY